MDLNESELNDLRNNIREIDKDLVSLFEKELLQHVSEKQNFIRWYTLLMDISKDIQKKLILGEKDD